VGAGDQVTICLIGLGRLSRGTAPGRPDALALSRWAHRELAGGLSRHFLCLFPPRIPAAVLWTPREQADEAAADRDRGPEGWGKNT